jgi:hypothetical protein
VVGKVCVGASDGLAARDILGFQRLSICGEDKFGFGFGRGRTGPQCLEGVTHGPDFAHGYVDVAALEHTTRHI